MFRLRSATADASAGLQFRLLGPVEIRSGTGVLGIGPPKQRTVLAVLLSMPNAVVSAEQFVDELWGASPPPSAVANIRGYVAGLRRASVAGEGLGTSGTGALPGR